MANAHPDPAVRLHAEARQALITPVVKAWLSDTGVDVTSTALQVHGGVGYVEEIGAAQHYRDARIAPIYEGTNGIQATDLTMRKLRLGDGKVVAAYLDELRAVADGLEAKPALKDTADGMRTAIDALAEATEWLSLRIGSESQSVAAGSTPYLNLFGTVAAAGAIAKLAIAACEEESGEWSKTFLDSRVTLARFFIQQLLPPAVGLVPSITCGAEALFELDPAAL
jgi:hypothetical protein